MEKKIVKRIIDTKAKESSNKKKMCYYGREWLFVAAHTDCSESYEEWYCMDTDEGMNIWSDGYIEIFECA